MDCHRRILASDQNHEQRYLRRDRAKQIQTVEGISKRVLQSKSERALNKFLNQYDWEEDRSQPRTVGSTPTTQRNAVVTGRSRHSGRLRHPLNRRSPSERWLVLRPAENDTVWGQNLVFSQYADEKTTYPLGFRLYEKEAESKIDHAKALVEEAHEVGVPADTYLSDSWYCSQELVEHVESYDKDWTSMLKSNRHVEYGGEMIRVDALAERIDTTGREVDETS